MQRIFENTSKVMVDNKNSNNLLNLPLDKLIQQAAIEANHPVVISPVPTPPKPSSNTLPRSNNAKDRNRENLRNRESRP